VAPQPVWHGSAEQRRNPSQTPNKVAYPARHRQDTIIGPIKNAARKLSKPSETVVNHRLPIDVTPRSLSYPREF